MWLLTNTATDCVFYLLQDKQQYSVGRIASDIVLSDDASISRNHAVLHCTVVRGETSWEVEDVNSKYGTFVNDGIKNNKKLEQNKKHRFRVGDSIRFGMLKNIWQVSQKQFNTMSSALTPSDAHDVQTNVSLLGGEVSSSWSSECTHLTMNEIAVTVKLLHALLEELPIVSSQYWQHIVKYARAGKSCLPSASDYLPTRNKSLLQLDFQLQANGERKRLFKGMTFVFMSKTHLDMYAAVVQKAGGKCRDLKAGIAKPTLIKPKVVVIQYVASTQSQSSQAINAITDFLEKNSLRVIPEYEIGMAILECSTAKHCNPEYTHEKQLIAESVNANVVLLNESKDTELSMPNSNAASVSELVVPETEQSEQMPRSTSGNKRCKVYAISSDEESESAINAQAAESLDVNISMNELPVDESQAAKPSNKSKSLAIDSDSDNEALAALSNKKRTESNQAAKRKRDSYDKSKSLQALDSESDDEALASLSKRANMQQSPTTAKTTTAQQSSTSSNNRRSATPKSKMKALQVTINNSVTRPKSIDVSGFLSKPSPANAANNISPMASSTQKTDSSEACNKRKRPIIAILNDDDDEDEDNLFCFDTKKNASKKIRNDFVNDDLDTVGNKQTLAFNKNNEDSDDELFGFTGMNTSKTIANANEHSQQDCDEDLPATESFMPHIAQRQTAKNIINLPKPKERPKIVDTSNWLSCSMKNMSIKPKMSQTSLALDDAMEDNKNDLDLKEYQERQEWIKRVQQGIHVETINVSLHGKDVMDYQSKRIEPSTSSSSVTLNTSGKNFKAFVKQRRVHPQQRIIKTIHVPVLPLHLR